jgi:hypothetical protein
VKTGPLFPAVLGMPSFAVECGAKPGSRLRKSNRDKNVVGQQQPQYEWPEIYFKNNNFS